MSAMSLALKAVKHRQYFVLQMFYHFGVDCCFSCRQWNDRCSTSWVTCGHPLSATSFKSSRLSLAYLVHVSIIALLLLWWDFYFILNNYTIDLSDWCCRWLWWRDLSVCITWTDLSVCITWTDLSVCITWTDLSVCITWTDLSALHGEICLSASHGEICLHHMDRSVCLHHMERSVCITWRDLSVCITWRDLSVCITWIDLSVCITVSIHVGWRVLCVCICKVLVVCVCVCVWTYNIQLHILWSGH